MCRILRTPYCLFLSIGSTSIKTTLLKDGHIFTVHVVDPKELSEESDDEDPQEKKDGDEKADFEKSEKEGKCPRSLV